MFFAYSGDNAVPYFNLLEIFILENIYKFNVALFTHKITNNVTKRWVGRGVEAYNLEFIVTGVLFHLF